MCTECCSVRKRNSLKWFPQCLMAGNLNSWSVLVLPITMAMKIRLNFCVLSQRNCITLLTAQPVNPVKKQRFCKNEVPGCEDNVERWQFFSFIRRFSELSHWRGLAAKEKIWFRQFSVDLSSTIFAYKLVSTSGSIARLHNGNRWCGECVLSCGCSAWLYSLVGWLPLVICKEMTMHSYFPRRHVALNVWCWMTQCWSVWRHFPTNHCKPWKDNVIGATHTHTNINVTAQKHKYLGICCFRISISPSWLYYTAHSSWLCGIIYYVITA